MTEAGFDLAPPATEIKNRIEVFREFDNEKGEPVTFSPIESKVDVKMSLRAIDSPVSNVAIVDMIPGGFEIDISPEGLGNRASGPTAATTWKPDFVDVREDRVVFYGTVTTDAQTFSYRLKPTNRGTFSVPPLYAEGMYDRSVQARSLGGQFQIGDAPTATNAMTISRPKTIREFSVIFGLSVTSIVAIAAVAVGSARSSAEAFAGQQSRFLASGLR